MDEINELLEALKNEIETVEPKNKRVLKEIKKKLTLLIVEINYLGEEE